MARKRKSKKRKIKIRKVWRINPRTRVKDSHKIYKRTKAKEKLKRVIRHET